MADSANTERDLEHLWHVPREKLSVVQGGIDPAHFRPIDNAAMLADVRSRYGASGCPYILAVSRLEPRKNFARLIEAFDLARQEAHLPHRLVIGGRKGWLYDHI